MKPSQFIQAGGKDRLMKALTSATGSGEALIPEILEPAITDEVQSLYPEFGMIKAVYRASDHHRRANRTSAGTFGGAQGENSTTPTKNSAFGKKTVDYKIVKRKFRVTDFLKDSTAENLDAFTEELEFQVREQAKALNTYNLYGNVVADGYQYNGWDPKIITNRYNDGFTAGAPTVPTGLTPLDDMIDARLTKGGSSNEAMFIMSPQLISTFSRLYSTVRKNIPMETIEFTGGHRLETYRGIPLVPSTYVPGKVSGTMGTVTAASGGTTGGSLSDGTYYFRVAAVTPDGGETMASAEASVTLAGGTATQKIDLSWTAIANAIAYKIYYSASTGLSAMTLIDWIAANTYDGDGTITGAVTGVTLLSVAASSAVTGITADKPLTAVGGVNGENIYLIDLREVQGMGRFEHNNRGQRDEGLISVKMLAETDSFREALIYSHGALIDAFEATSVKSSGWRAK